MIERLQDYERLTVCLFLGRQDVLNNRETANDMRLELDSQETDGHTFPVTPLLPSYAWRLYAKTRNHGKGMLEVS